MSKIFLTKSHLDFGSPSPKSHLDFGLPSPKSHSDFCPPSPKSHSDFSPPSPKSHSDFATPSPCYHRAYYHVLNERSLSTRVSQTEGCGHETHMKQNFFHCTHITFFKNKTTSINVNLINFKGNSVKFQLNASYCSQNLKCFLINLKKI